MPLITDDKTTKFGRLTFVEEVGMYEVHGYRRNSARFSCDCGAVVVKAWTHVLRGLVQSCGCYKAEAIRRTKRTHGDYNSTEYKTWAGIKQRCGNPNHVSFARYGAKGVSICDRWKNDYQAFLDDLGRRPEGCNSIDRINPSKGYEPGNVRWSTALEQGRNRSCVIVLHVDGEPVGLAEFCARSGISYDNVQNRRHRSRWPTVRAVSHELARLGARVPRLSSNR